MVKHRSGTRWLDDREVGWHCVQSVPYTRRREERVSWLSLKTKVDGFPGLCLKTSSCSLVIWPTKSLWRFLSLVLKTKWVMIFRLRHKSDRRMKTAQDTCRDLAACYIWKLVWLGFLSLAPRLADVRYGWCTRHHRGGRVEMKPNTDGQCNGLHQTLLPQLYRFCCIRS
jgi:hypothetical protein